MTIRLRPAVPGADTASSVKPGKAAPVVDQAWVEERVRLATGRPRRPA